jgi:hypothetical protein
MFISPLKSLTEIVEICLLGSVGRQLPPSLPDRSVERVAEIYTIGFPPDCDCQHRDGSTQPSKIPKSPPRWYCSRPPPTTRAVTSSLRFIQATSQESTLSSPNSPTNVANQQPPTQTRNRRPRHKLRMLYIWPSSVVHVRFVRI